MSPKQRQDAPSPGQVRQALERALRSDAFANSPKLMSFLAYTVEEELAGRGKAIKGKSVATDVYQRQLDEAGSAQNLVRVEARRLRRVLAEYYTGEGRSDPVQIRLDTGSYRPRFEMLMSREVVPEPPHAIPAPEQLGQHVARPWRLPAVALSGLCLFLIWVAATGAFKNAPPTAQATVASSELAELSALRQRSIRSVQAVNLAEQTRGLFFPLFDLERQRIALDAFRHATDLDPDLPGGYAGAAQVLALLSFLSDDPAMADALLAEARQMADRAVEHDPTDGWAQAAQGWVQVTGGDTERALRHARIALDLSAEDGHVQDLVALTGLVANDPMLMAEASNPARARSGTGRFGANSLWGTSQLMLGNYAETIKAFSTAAERGQPVSAPSLLLLATAYYESADSERAQQAIEEMVTTWPGFPASAVAARFFANDSATLKRVEATLAAFLPRP